jgi:agmatine/peptidylarginine deiminase
MTEEEKAKADEIGKDFYETAPPTGNIRPVAEFEPMESVLIRYPFGIPMNFIATLSQEIKVVTIVENQSEQNTVMTQYENNGVNTDSVSFIHAPTDSYWARDYGPWYIEHGNHEIGIVNFPYNRPRPGDDDIPIVVADSLNVDLFGMDLIHTGGNYMADGRNIAASTNLVIEENPDYSVDEINSLMEDYLGVTTYQLLDDPLGDYIKHIDCWGKFLGVDKVLIGEVPESDPRYEDYESVAEYYENATSAWGTPYEVYRVFTPGGSPATPYTNALILNDRVFVPLTGSQWDDEAIQTYEEAMPGYEIIGVDEQEYNWKNTDALHCRTHEMADRNMLKIKHTPLSGTVENLEEQMIEAKIIPFSNEPVYSDSLKVFYKLNDQNNYSSVKLQNTEGYNYEATIPVPGDYNEVHYYIHAADHSGRSENHPYIGGADPHTFLEAEPPQLITKDTSIYINENGTATLKNKEVVSSASGTCEIVDTSLSKTNFTCSDIGSNQVIVTIEDCNGITSKDTVLINIADTLSPILLTQDTTLELNSEGQASLKGPELVQSAHDNCSVSDTLISQTQFSTADIGTIPVNITLEDHSGNKKSLISEVTVKSNEPPALTLKDKTLGLDINGKAAITKADIIKSASDNHILTDTTITQNTFNCSDTGMNNIIVSITDGAGNTTSEEAEITIEDNISPTFTLINDTVFLDESGVATITASEVLHNVSDNCSLKDTVLSQAEFSEKDLGVVTIDVKVGDQNNNTTIHSAEITVKDTIYPVLSTKNTTVELHKNGNATISSSDVIDEASDNCSLTDTILSQTEFTSADIGENIVEITIKDISDNTVSEEAIIQVEEVTGFNIIAEKEIQIFPNPAKDKLHINSKRNNQIKSITITNLMGKTLINKTNLKNNETIDLTNIEPGYYIVKINTGKNSISRKILKE